MPCWEPGLPIPAGLVVPEPERLAAAGAAAARGPWGVVSTGALAAAAGAEAAGVEAFGLLASTGAALAQAGLVALAPASPGAALGQAGLVALAPASPGAALGRPLGPALGLASTGAVGRALGTTGSGFCWDSKPTREAAVAVEAIVWAAEASVWAGAVEGPRGVGGRSGASCTSSCHRGSCRFDPPS